MEKPLPNISRDQTTEKTVLEWTLIPPNNDKIMHDEVLSHTSQNHPNELTLIMKSSQNEKDIEEFIEEENDKEIQIALDKYIESADNQSDKQLPPDSLNQNMELLHGIGYTPLDRLLELDALDIKDWLAVHDSEYIRVFKRKEEDSPVVLIKVLATLDSIPPEKVFRLIYDLDIRREWDSVLSSMRTFDRLSEEIDHMYSVYKAPIGISNRDFCQRRTKAKNYKGVPYLIHLESVVNAECPQVKGIVRAHTTISGYIIRPGLKGTQSTEMTIFSQTDIKGKIPKTIINMAAAKAPASWCKNFKAHAEKLIKAGRI